MMSMVVCVTDLLHRGVKEEGKKVENGGRCMWETGFGGEMRVTLEKSQEERKSKKQWKVVMGKFMRGRCEK